MIILPLIIIFLIAVLGSMYGFPCLSSRVVYGAITLLCIIGVFRFIEFIPQLVCFIFAIITFIAMIENRIDPDDIFNGIRKLYFRFDRWIDKLWDQ